MTGRVFGWFDYLTGGGRRSPLPRHLSRRAQMLLTTLEDRTVPVSGLSPSQVTHFYGLDNINFGDSIKGDGTGQTIALIDPYDNPGFVSTGSAGFAASDLHQFDLQFNLPDPPSFIKVDQTGGSNYPAAASKTIPPGREARGATKLPSTSSGLMPWPRAPTSCWSRRSTSNRTSISPTTYGAGRTGVVAVSMSYGGSEYRR